MNLSTLTFSYKSRVIALLGAALTLYFITNVGCYFVEHKLRGHGYSQSLYGVRAQDSLAMLANLYGEQKPDIIFVGNSQTQTQINSNLFHRNGIRVINYSFSGYFIHQYYEMVENAIELKPDMIAISVSLDDLFKGPDYVLGHYNYENDLSLRSLKFLIHNTHDINQLKYTSKIAFNFVKHSQYFIEKGYQLRARLNAFYQKHARGNLGSANAAAFNPMKITPDCHFLADGSVTPAFCYNGDASYVGQTDKEDLSRFNQSVLYSEATYNYSMVSLFNRLFDHIKANGIQPVLIVVPSFSKPDVNNDLLAATIRAHVINLAAMPIPLNHFHDSAHLNFYGRDDYTKKLIQRLRPAVLISRNKVNTKDITA